MPERALATSQWELVLGMFEIVVIRVVVVKAGD